MSLKALIEAKKTTVKNHKLSEFIKEMTELYPDKYLINFYEKYINPDNMPLILKEFCQASNITMDLYFQSLKYPASTRGIEFNHSRLRFHGLNGVELFQEISHDLKKSGL